MVASPTSGLRMAKPENYASEEISPKNSVETNTVFYYVAMDLVAKSHFMRANVRSLREKGQFKGPIVFATDHAECLIDNLGNDILGQKDEHQSTGDVYVFSGPEKGASIHIKNVGHNSKFDKKNKIKMGFEEHKALAKVYTSSVHLPFDNYNTVIIDDDILIGKPLDEFIKAINSVKQPLATFKDIGNGNEKFHCGLIVVRPDGDKCMESWMDVLKKEFGNVEGIAIHDTESLEFEGRGQKAFARGACAKDGRVDLLNNKKLGFTFPTASSLKLKDFDKVPTFTHFTNSYRLRKLDKSQVGDFYNRVFNLDIDIAKGETTKQCQYESHTYQTYVR